jgi:hypothetical protein
MTVSNTLANDRVVIPGDVDESPRLFSATYLFMKSASLLVVLFFASSPGFTASASPAANATAASSRVMRGMILLANQSWQDRVQEKISILSEMPISKCLRKE